MCAIVRTLVLMWLNLHISFLTNAYPMSRVINEQKGTENW